MCISFYRINGVPACANKKLLTDILRNEWNFKGYVVSDQGALGKALYLTLTSIFYTSFLLSLPSLSLILFTSLKYTFLFPENIVTEHHYAPDFVTAAADAANAGTCLEDGNSEDRSGNVYDNLDEAVEQVLKRTFIPLISFFFISRILLALILLKML